jgi:predicted AlkP superfamily phosphohydrolase/phosphomutase
MRSVNASDRHATPFWTILNDDGTSTGLFKVPFTYPPDEVNGFMITGFPTPSTVDDFAYPKSISNRISSPKEIFENREYLNDGNYEAFKQDLIDVASKQTKLLLEMIEDRQTDFLMTVYDGADRIQHFFWKYFDTDHPRYESDPKLSSAIRQYYQVVDDGIGELLEATSEETNVLILSDHGFGPLSYDIYIDEWLENKNYLSRRSEHTPREFTVTMVGRLLKYGWEVVTRMGVDGFVESILPDQLFEHGHSMQKTNRRAIIWEDTRAFFTSLSGQAININSEERYSNGIVSEDEYEAVIEALSSELLDLNHPQTEEQLIKNVVRTDQEFNGWMVDQAPDLIVESASGYTLKDGRSNMLIKPSKQAKNDRSGDHRTRGILIANGPAFDTGTIKKPSVLDIAPTLLYLHNSPIPEVMDGRVLKPLFNKNACKSRNVKRTSNYGEMNRESREWSEEEAIEMEEKLRDMGYL